MYELMKLEQKKNDMQRYLMMALLIMGVMLIFLYLFAYMPHFGSIDEDLEMFGDYPRLIALTGSLNMAGFSILSSVIFSKIMIEEYDGNKAILLFSYPVGRKRIYHAKVLVVVLFTLAAAFVSNMLIFTVLAITEVFSPMVNDQFTIMTSAILLRKSFLMAVLSAGMGTVSMYAGFQRKSIPVTIVTDIILCILFTNLVAGSGEHEVLILIPAVAVVLLCAVLLKVLGEKINSMEV